MKYDIYFHNDFDGAASAAIMLQFFESRGDSVARFEPVHFGMKRKWPEGFAFRNPSVVLDFPYHPRATFWYDHHPTGLGKIEKKKRFHPTKFKRLDARYASCCSLVLDALRKGFGFKPPAHFRELVRWGDIIDKANYNSPRQAIAMKEAALQIDAFIDAYAYGKGFFNWFVPLLASMPMTSIARDKRFRRGMRIVRADRQKALEFYKKNLRIENGVGYINLTGSRFKRKLNMAPYYLCPELRYNVTLKRSRSFSSHASASTNPWRRKENALHIGNMLRKYGGGGHKDVGGVEFRSYRKAEITARELVRLFLAAAK